MNTKEAVPLLVEPGQRKNQRAYVVHSAGLLAGLLAQMVRRGDLRLFEGDIFDATGRCLGHMEVGSRLIDEFEATYEESGE